MRSPGLSRGQIQTHRNYPARLNNLANGLRRRYERDGQAADADEAMAAYRRGQRLGLQVATEAALRCGLNWGDWSVRRRRWAQAHEAYDVARTAAERLLGQHLVRHDVEAWLSAVGDMPAQAAYMHGARQKIPARQPYGSNGGGLAYWRM